MELLKSLFQEYGFIINITILVLLLIVLFLEVLNRIELNRVEKRYRKLMKGNNKNLEELIMSYTENIDSAVEKVNQINESLKDVDSRLKKCIQKVGIVRYRAFDDVGSDLSFSVALLDENNDGIVLTGLFGRSECTTFAKPIENGISKYDLSDEEKQALDQALR
ncbi:DUF4446 family protein [Thermobrachium celere]|uniref:Uncharacterized protein n=1 Tax=Thermobrachium celere DSM 8682 TaxID=941824 RepID=R7RSF3_9CLOT|nr:DUF4446 family protein [Thermobrachium celere]CDF58974.1 FIG072699: hypothetical protein [Thermobrachium celere DSM 8682]